MIISNLGHMEALAQENGIQGAGYDCKYYYKHKPAQPIEKPVHKPEKPEYKPQVPISFAFATGTAFAFGPNAVAAVTAVATTGNGKK